MKNKRKENDVGERNGEDGKAKCEEEETRGQHRELTWECEKGTRVMLSEKLVEGRC